jgi:BirA family biotin operon repressor/biotin-[acetyl-CoA-carboxylase] ligase
MSGKSEVRWDDRTEEQLSERWDRAVRLADEVTSTNDVAKEWAEAGAPEGAVVLARKQRKGRGRVGRSWYSPRDRGVYLSAVFHPVDLSHPGPLCILAGLGIAERLSRAFPGLDPRIKWPNDLMAGERKFGGVLAEAAWSAAHPRHLVVGVGVNVRPLGRRAPEDVQGGAVSVDELLDGTASLLEVADAVVAGLDAYAREPEPVLSEALLDRVDRLDWLKGRRVVLRASTADAEGIPGTPVGIAPDGALLFRPDRGALRRVQSGTVEWR